jgi:hypothetical protein
MDRLSQKKSNNVANSTMKTRKNNMKLQDGVKQKPNSYLIGNQIDDETESY